MPSHRYEPSTTQRRPSEYRGPDSEGYRRPGRRDFEEESERGAARFRRESEAPRNWEDEERGYRGGYPTSFEGYQGEERGWRGSDYPSGGWRSGEHSSGSGGWRSSEYPGGYPGGGGGDYRGGYREDYPGSRGWSSYREDHPRSRAAEPHQEYHGGGGGGQEWRSGQWRQRPSWAAQSWEGHGQSGLDWGERGEEQWRSRGGFGGGGGTSWREMESERETHRGQGPKGYRRSDDRIREDVNDALTEDPMIDASDVEVEVSNGEVTLNGAVPERRMRRRAEELAEACSGVTYVQNNLRVKREGESAGQRGTQGQTGSSLSRSHAGTSGAGTSGSGMTGTLSGTGSTAGSTGPGTKKT